MEEQPLIKAPVMEVDFINNIISEVSLEETSNKAGLSLYPRTKSSINPDMKERFLKEIVGDIWHSEKDVLEFLIFYNTKEYFCQRKKLKYDFNTGASYWSTYEFKGATEEQAVELQRKIANLTASQNIIDKFEMIGKVEKVDKEYFFYDQRYLKRVDEKNKMLAATDWRVLPDVVDSYPGEKDMWIKWRDAMRNLTIKHPSEFENSLELLKHIYNVRWPIDPKKYKELYPEGDVEYLSTEDQWVDRDVEASTDFVASRLRNIMELRQRYVESGIKVKKEVLEMMKLLKVEDFTEAGIDYTLLYTEEELDDLQS